MWKKKEHSIKHRIASVHLPHVRPIVRVKARAKTEFGSKLHMSLSNGYSSVDHLSSDAYNEGSLLIDYVEQYRRRRRYYPKEVLADQIYCSTENRRKLR